MKTKKLFRLLYEVAWICGEWSLAYGALYASKHWAENIFSFFIYLGAISSILGVFAAKVAFEKWGLAKTKEFDTKRAIPIKVNYVLDLGLCTLLIANGWWVRGSLLFFAIAMRFLFHAIKDDYIKTEEAKLPKPEKPDINRFANGDRMIRVDDEKSTGFIQKLFRRS